VHLPIDSVHHLLQTWGYVAVFVFVAVEYAGIPVPGETMLIAAAAYAGTGQLQIAQVITIAAVGVTTGSTVGYVVGRTGGRELVLRYGKYVRLDAAKLRAGEDFFAKHGDKTVVLGRFVAVLRTFACLLAGLNRMPWGRFMVFNIVGAVFWAMLWGVLAFELGQNLSMLETLVRTVGIIGAAIVVVAALVIFVLYRRGRRLKLQVQRGSGEDDVPDKTGSM